MGKAASTSRPITSYSYLSERAADSTALAVLHRHKPCDHAPVLREEEAGHMSLSCSLLSGKAVSLGRHGLKSDLRKVEIAPPPGCMD